jgi:chromosomal replication initiation ATPase DnaA
MSARLARLGRQIVMQDDDGERLVDVDAVLAPIAHRYGVTLAELRGPCRESELVEARVAAIHHLYGLGFGVGAIGRALNRDHSTVLHHLRNGVHSSTP